MANKTFHFIDGIPATKPRTRKDMIAYLKGHFRYNTMNSCNNSTSYAHDVKVHNVNLPPDEPKTTQDRMWEIMEVDNVLSASGYNRIMRDFDRRHNYQWQHGHNGRSGGYVVLYQGEAKRSEHRSYCTNCGQRNFKSVMPAADTIEGKVFRVVAKLPAFSRHLPGTIFASAEIKDLQVDEVTFHKIYREIEKSRSKDGSLWLTEGAQCGVCHEPDRVNYTEENWPRDISAWPGRSTDMHEDFGEWDISTIRGRVELVWDFDHTVNRAVEAFVNYARNHAVEEQTVMVPKQIKVAVEA